MKPFGALSTKAFGTDNPATIMRSTVSCDCLSHWISAVDVADITCNLSWMSFVPRHSTHSKTVYAECGKLRDYLRCIRLVTGFAIPRHTRSPRNSPRLNFLLWQLSAAKHRDVHLQRQFFDRSYLCAPNRHRRYSGCHRVESCADFENLTTTATVLCSQASPACLHSLRLTDMPSSPITSLELDLTLRHFGCAACATASHNDFLTPSGTPFWLFAPRTSRPISSPSIPNRYLCYVLL